MITDAERLEKLERLIEELLDIGEREAIIVEGVRDVSALGEFGVVRNVKTINVGDSIVNFVDSLSGSFDRVIILTDWDRKGGQLAMLVRKALESSDLKYDDQIRKHISTLTKKEIKDVEGLPSYIDRLRRSVMNRIVSAKRGPAPLKKD